MSPPHAMMEELRLRLRGISSLSSREVAELMGRHEITADELLVALLPIAAERARSPVSKFRVGAVALGMPDIDRPGLPGACYLGANLEFANVPLCLTVHAEQSAVNNAWLHNERGVSMLAVTAAPCGFCRQFLQELTTALQLRVIVATRQQSGWEWTSTSLPQLLPSPFGPATLGCRHRLMEVDIRQDEPSADASLTSQASMAAVLSYAPYSDNRAGVAFATKSLGPVWGRSAESAAFNPTLTAMQSALAMLALRTSSEFHDEVTAACLAECPTNVSQRAVSELLLSEIGPQLTLEHHAMRLVRFPAAAASE
ncbi:MAG: cytidine deaminase [Planctomycetaceae bacterium]